MKVYCLEQWIGLLHGPFHNNIDNDDNDEQNDKKKLLLQILQLLSF